MKPILQSPVANAAPAAPTAPAALLACLLEGLPHAAWVVDLARRCVVAVNPAAAVLLGQPVLTLMGQAPQGLASTLEDLAWWDAAQAGDTTPLLSRLFWALWLSCLSRWWRCCGRAGLAGSRVCWCWA